MPCNGKRDFGSGTRSTSALWLYKPDHFEVSFLSRGKKIMKASNESVLHTDAYYALPVGTAKRGYHRREGGRLLTNLDLC